MSKEETIKFRVSAEEKAAYEDKAKRAGLTLSSLIRAVLQNPGKIVFIEEGTEIAKGFGTCQRLLAHYMATGQMTDGERMELRQSMDNITNLLYTVTKNLTSIDIEMDDDDLEEM